MPSRPRLGFGQAAQFGAPGQELAEPREPQPAGEASSEASQGEKQYLSCSLPFASAASNGS